MKMQAKEQSLESNANFGYRNREPSKWEFGLLKMKFEEVEEGSVEIIRSHRSKSTLVSKRKRLSKWLDGPIGCQYSLKGVVEFESKTEKTFVLIKQVAVFLSVES